MRLPENAHLPLQETMEREIEEEDRRVSYGGGMNPALPVPTWRGLTFFC